MSDQFAIATLCSAGYVHWLEHLHRNLNLLRLVPPRLTVCVTDLQTRATARTLQLDTLLVADASTEQRHATAHAFGTEAYASVTRRKASCVLTVLTRRQPPPALLFTDMDVTFFASPWAHLPSRTVDIALLDDGGPSQMSHNTLNSGFFFVRNLTSTCLASLLYAHATDSHRSAATPKPVREQWQTRYLLVRCATRRRCVRCGGSSSRTTRRGPTSLTRSPGCIGLDTMVGYKVLRPGCVGMRPGCVGMRSGCVGLQPQGAAQPP